MTRTDSPQTNPSLKELEGLAGDWEMELSNAAFLPSPSDRVEGRVSFEWVEAGAFLLMRMRAKSAPDAIWLISRDEASVEYKVFYYDARKVSRVYQMSFAEGAWKMWRQAPGFSQRYEGKVSQDGKTVSGHWEKSSDGASWEHDFDVRYRRLK